MTNVQVRLKELLDIVSDADCAVMDVYDSHSALVKFKQDDTPVTQADIASHEIISSGLTALFPEVPVVSEEGDESENVKTVKSECFWLVDPLDGTREFINRTGHFTICIALIENDQPIFGVVSAPALNVVYYGGRGFGSYKVRDGKTSPILVSPKDVGVVLVSRSDLNEQTADYIAEHHAACEIKAVGSQLKLPYIAEGIADVYPRLGGPLHLWDLAAGHAILEAAGGSVKRPDGSSVTYHGSLLVGDFVATRF